MTWVSQTTNGGHTVVFLLEYIFSGNGNNFFTQLPSSLCNRVDFILFEHWHIGG